MAMSTTDFKKSGIKKVAGSRSHMDLHSRNRLQRATMATSYEELLSKESELKNNQSNWMSRVVDQIGDIVKEDNKSLPVPIK